MLNKLCAFARRYGMFSPGDAVVCAVSGGADSVALLFALYLLKDKLGISLRAAHFNHGLRGAESDADEDFVRQFCRQYDIPLFCGSGTVSPGKKGLEAAARDARYAFLNSLPGKIATAHTADDNAETVLMHLVRGTGLKGLGGIAPVNGKVVRPMLGVTREEVLSFLRAYHLRYVVDSSNETDQFLRNRLRHHVLPLLKEENPRLASNMSAMALRLRTDEDALRREGEDRVSVLKAMHPAHRVRALAALMEDFGVKEPDGEHIALAESLVFSQNPSARVQLKGGITLCRNYDRLEKGEDILAIPTTELNCPGVTDIPTLGLRVRCEAGAHPGGMWVQPEGKLLLRSRQSGDEITLSGGTKSLKKLFIDRKIPAAQRSRIAVISDELGVLCVYGVGVNTRRIPHKSDGISIFFENIAVNKDN